VGDPQSEDGFSGRQLAKNGDHRQVGVAVCHQKKPECIEYFDPLGIRDTPLSANEVIHGVR
jgi:hypothetical protein